MPKQLLVEDTETTCKDACSLEARKTDFADGLIECTGTAHECEYTSTFD
jgi:hypothetical protein